jgi:protein FAM50
VKKKARKNLGKLSFAADEDEDSTDRPNLLLTKSKKMEDSASKDKDAESIIKKKLAPSSSVSVMPKLMTKSALTKEAQTREQYRKEFLILQELVKETEIIIPFVFFDGSNIPGGACRVKKSDHIWFFLDKARKVGAGMGGNSGGRRGWARISVDDLILVRGEMMIPHVSLCRRVSSQSHME